MRFEILAGIPNANTIRDIQSDRDAQISTVQLLANALGLRMDLVEAMCRRDSLESRSAVGPFP